MKCRRGNYASPAIYYQEEWEIFMIQNADEELEAERQEKIKKLKKPEPTGNLRKCNCNRQEKDTQESYYYYHKDPAGSITN